MEFIRNQNLPLATYLAQAEYRLVDEETLEWDFKDNAFQMGLLEGNGNKKKLEKLCQDFFKRRIKIRYISREKTPTKRRRNVSEDSSKKISYKETLNHPQVKDLIDLFQAEVVDIKRPSEGEKP
jgi:hypothetical protein